MCRPAVKKVSKCHQGTGTALRIISFFRPCDGIKLAKANDVDRKTQLAKPHVINKNPGIYLRLLPVTDSGFQYMYTKLYHELIQKTWCCRNNLKFWYIFFIAYKNPWQVFKFASHFVIHHDYTVCTLQNNIAGLSLFTSRKSLKSKFHAETLVQWSPCRRLKSDTLCETASY